MSKISQTLRQAKDSLKVLDTLEKETIAKIKSLARLPKRLPKAADEALLHSLRALGLASQHEVDALTQRVEALEKRAGSQEST